MPELTLYHFPPSGPSRVALLAARSVGVDVDVKIMDLFKKEHLNPDFIKLNPQHTVPTLTDGDFVLWESRAIAIYLAETYAKDDTLYPKDLQQRAIVNQRLYFDHGYLYSRIRAICFPVLFFGETEISEEKKKSLEEGFDFLDIFLKDSPWVAGQNHTIADCACAASVSTIVAVGYDISKHKPIVDWLEKCKAELPGYSENEEGANIFGQEVRKGLKPGQL